MGHEIRRKQMFKKYHDAGLASLRVIGKWDIATTQWEIT